MERTKVLAALCPIVPFVLGANMAIAGTPDAGTSDAGGARAARDAGPKETADQRGYRMRYVAETVQREGEIAKHHVWTPEMSKASWTHWRRAYRALRIRELAQDDGEDAAVARVDAYMKKSTDHFLTLLAELTAKSPEVPGPPTLTSPAAGAALAVGTPVTFKMAPYKDATQYYCWFWQPGGHYWSNWQASSESYGTSPECTIPGDDPKWSKFHSGKAEFYGRAIVPTKTAAGKDYKMWSEAVKLEVAVTGGAAPSGSGSGDAGSAIPLPPRPPAPKPSASTGDPR
jgi:hypothetical protein